MTDPACPHGPNCWSCSIERSNREIEERTAARIAEVGQEAYDLEQAEFQKIMDEGAVSSHRFMEDISAEGYLTRPRPLKYRLRLAWFVLRNGRGKDDSQ